MTKKVSEQSRFPQYFLLSILIIYAMVYFYNTSIFAISVESMIRILWSIIPTLILVLAFLVIFNYFAEPKKLSEYFGKQAGIGAWFIAVIAGIISAGPIYMWYPLLSELQEKGVKNGLLAAFLYNRGIKIPLIPVMVVYFNWVFILILFILMTIVSIIQGLILDKIIGKETK